MNYPKACKLLHIDTNEPLSTDKLKSHYRTSALKYHPDKNTSPNANEEFQNINEAYQYLQKYSNVNNNDNINWNMTYSDMLMSFIQNIIPIDRDSQILHIIIQKINHLCENKTVDLLNSIDKDMLIKIYNLIKKNQEILQFGDELIEIVESVISDKTKHDEVIILNPTIHDLLEDNLYRLTINNGTYVIPLWHNELVYDNCGNDIYVKCNPILEDDVRLDESNNLHISKTLKISEIWGKEEVMIKIHNIELKIYTNKLKFMKTQIIRFVGSGISQINVKNIYDVSSRCDVYMTLDLIM
tara:strand:+ start:1116 stop:2009 length:894 start_codon:yes stop_codon:yes gene_type:complete